MDEQENERTSFFDISQYSEKTRKVIFGVMVGLLLAVVMVAMFVISPQTEKQSAEPSQPTVTAKATQAAVDDVVIEPAQPTYEGSFPKDESEAAALEQQKIIEEGLEEQAKMLAEEAEDFHEDVPDSEALKTIATKGILEYCTDIAGETKEQKQERMKPYFHADNSSYQSPKTLFVVQKCSLGDATEPAYDEEKNIVVYVGVAWAGKIDEKGSADTGYSQYRVIVDKSGIVSSHD